MRYPKLYLNKTCETCGNVFERKPKVTYKQWATTRFCSPACVSKWRFGNKIKHPRWKGGPVEKECAICSKMFIVSRARSNTARFCSYACKVAAQDNNVSTENEKVRKSNRYKEWRKEVFQRDDYMCQICGERGGHLHADHIQPFAVFYESRFDLDNGRTLCVTCHKLTPTYGKPVSYVKGF